MPRMILSPRQMDTIDLHIGHVLIFCEGFTEENYFNFFKRQIGDKYANIEIEVENAKSNARAVLNYANKFFEDSENISKYKNYEKYLVFDCDAPDDILNVIDEAEKSEYNYILLVSSLLFEDWLLMHLEEIEEGELRKTKIAAKLTSQLDLDDYEKHKDDEGIIAKILVGNQNVEKAILNAKSLRSRYEDKGYDMKHIISKYLPYSKVDILVEQLAKAASHY